MCAISKYTITEYKIKKGINGQGGKIEKVGSIKFKKGKIVRAKLSRYVFVVSKKLRSMKL